MNHAGDFIEIYPDVLSAEQCQAIIRRFEASGQAVPGRVGHGVMPDLKDSRDITITGQQAWSDVENMLNQALFTCYMQYLRKYCYALIAPLMLQWQDSQTGTPRRIVESDFADMPDAQLSALVGGCFRPGAINLQHYRAGKGGYPYWHCELFPKDATCEQLHRHVLWTIYLNDGFSEGETEFLYQRRKITPQRGALLIAPTAFTHTHRGNRPVGADKYIATSWVLFQRAEKLFAPAPG
ncbi:MAG: 2OG-Fe(II) oxygenase [Xanthomonadales bacterium]|nr:2OG-Fe(II) oxygenase [Xanthomonadales bacterium]